MANPITTEVSFARIPRRSVRVDTISVALFSNAYSAIIALGSRDLGLNPVTVKELAKNLRSTPQRIREFIGSHHEAIADDMIIDLGSKMDQPFKMRERRLLWALDYAEKNSIQYPTLSGFLPNRLGISPSRFSTWIAECKGLEKLVEGRFPMIWH